MMNNSKTGEHHLREWFDSLLRKPRFDRCSLRYRSYFTGLHHLHQRLHRLQLLHLHLICIVGAYSNLRYGAITYNITGGTGVFEGSHGAMVDTFVSTQLHNSSAPFTINAWGIVWLAL